MVKLALIGMSLNLALNLTLIPIFGEKATAFAQLVAEMTVCLFAFYFSRKVLDFNFPIKKLLKNILLAISFSFITLILNNITKNPFFVLIFSTFICISYHLYFQIFIIKEQLILNYFNLLLNFRLLKKNNT
jgi:peptidoglycan biosynthesis protein MviN/MurJ (putative lipid II flippase)